MKDDIKLLNEKLISMLYDRFKLKIRLKNNSLKKVDLLKKNRKNISRIKKIINIKNKFYNKNE